MIYPEDIREDLGNTCGHNDCAGELEWKGRSKNNGLLWWKCLECGAETYVDYSGHNWTEPKEVLGD